MLPRELDHRSKGLINIQNTNDNECIKWCLVKQLNLADHSPRRITKELKYHIKDCFKGNSKQTIKIPKKGKYIKLKNFGT